MIRFEKELTHMTTPAIKVAIHQADFFPWLGFFNKYYRSDKFIIHDFGQYPKGTSDYTSRVKLIIAGKEDWIKIPIRHDYHGFKRYDEMLMDDSKPWRRKMKNTVFLNYKKSPHFETIFPVFESLIDFRTENQFLFNMNILRALFDVLGLRTDKLVYGTSLHPDGAVKSDMIIDLVHKAGGGIYLSGLGGSEYQDDEYIKRKGIAIEYNQFKQKPYAQAQSPRFIPGLSVLDALMSCGIKTTQSLLKDE